MLVDRMVLAAQKGSKGKALLDNPSGFYTRNSLPLLLLHIALPLCLHWLVHWCNIKANNGNAIIEHDNLAVIF